MPHEVEREVRAREEEERDLRVRPLRGGRGPRRRGSGVDAEEGEDAEEHGGGEGEAEP